MQDPTERNLEPFFDATRLTSFDLPEHARRRILLEAEVLQPKQAKPKSWRMPRLWPSLQFGAAMASLAIGFFLGLSQPESITAFASFNGLTNATTISDESDDILGGFSGMLIESDSL